MQIAKVAALAGLGLLALAGAQAQAAPWSGYVVDNVNERAGPSTYYPSVVVIPAGAPVAIYGCLEDYTWCDVAWGPSRGWVAASYVQVTYDDEPVPLDEYIEPLGVPIISFDFDTYWGDYYRGRPFYGDAYRWRHWRADHYMQPPRPHWDWQQHGYNPNWPHKPYPGQFDQHNDNHFPQQGNNPPQGNYPPQGNFPKGNYPQEGNFPQGNGNFDHPKPHGYQQPIFGNGGSGGGDPQQRYRQFGDGKPPKFNGGQGGQAPDGCHFDHGNMVCPPK